MHQKIQFAVLTKLGFRSNDTLNNTSYICCGPQRFQESLFLTSLVDMTFTMSKGQERLKINSPETFEDQN